MKFFLFLNVIFNKEAQCRNLSAIVIQTYNRIKQGSDHKTLIENIKKASSDLEALKKLFWAVKVAAKQHLEPPQLSILL